MSKKENEGKFHKIISQVKADVKILQNESVKSVVSVKIIFLFFFSILHTIALQVNVLAGQAGRFTFMFPLLF